MKVRDIVRRVWNFYRDGFRGMDTGRVLWIVVLVKLFIIFIVLKIFFFPDILRERAGAGHEADYVSEQITRGGGE